MKCCADVRATHRKQQTPPTLNGGDRGGVWIILFSEVTLCLNNFVANCIAVYDCGQMGGSPAYSTQSFGERSLL